MEAEDVIIGIDPITKCCEFVSFDRPEDWLECREMGLIVVQTTREKARAAFGEVIDDVYSLSYE